MGIDWIRMYPKAGTDRAELLRLIEQQATAFQGMPYYWSTDPIETPVSYHEDTRRQYEEQYQASSLALRQLLEFPLCNPDTGIPNDCPDLECCWRVYPITNTIIFPPRWRQQAHRTILPEDLPGQIAVWKAWTAAVAEGQHQTYLADLYIYQMSMFLVTHCEHLKGLARASFSKTAKWASKPELAAVRERILALPTPIIHPAPLELALTASERLMNTKDQSFIAALWNQIDELITLTQSWDSKAKEGWKLRYERGHYQTFQEFLDQAKQPWLHSFLDWAERCSSMGFGLFLDY